MILVMTVAATNWEVHNKNGQGDIIIMLLLLNIETTALKYQSAIKAPISKSFLI